MAVTLKEVAARAGVSRAAVSRTFTPGASVSPGMRARVEQAAAELGYSPNLLARALSTRKTQLVGLISNNFHNPAFLQIFDLFTRELQDQGLRPLLVNLSDQTTPGHSLNLARQYSVDGVIIASSHVPDNFAEAFQKAGMPVVHAFGSAARTQGVAIAAIDNVAAGRMAAQTLMARGYRRIGFMGGPEGASTTRDRLQGFLEAARAGGVPVSVSYAGAYGFEQGRAQMQRLLRDKTRAEAYFCADDVLSIGALSAMRDAGLAVPDEIGVIGLNDMEMSGWAGIDLTTIHQPFAAIVSAAIDMIVARFRDPDLLPETRLFPCRIVERKTLRPLP